MFASRRFLNLSNRKLKEKRMNAIKFTWRRLFASIVTLALVLGVLGAVGTATAQEKKEEKKDEKKDEKKLALPLKSDRKIEFTTDEGTWLSLDVSPDGKTIVFELLGDIYTLPIEGGQAKLVSGGMAFDSQPRFSPDGKWIAFLSDREGSDNVWIMHSDGTDPKQVSKDPGSDFVSPSWAPDGKYIFVSKAGFGIAAYEIWMYHMDGGTGIQITKAKPSPATPRRDRPNDVGVVASADGKYLYYAERRGP